MVDEVLVVTAVLSTELVVGAHDGNAPCLFHGSFKAREINLTQGAFIHLRIHSMPVQLLVVRGKVLDASRHLLALDPLNYGYDQFGYQAGILTEILKIASAERSASDIDARAQNEVLAAMPCFGSQNRPESPGDVR